jgi:hypothetical protein
LLQGIWNLIPHQTLTVGGGPSDGLQIWRILRGKPTHGTSGRNPWNLQLPGKEGEGKFVQRSERIADKSKDPDFKTCPECGESVPLLTRECVCTHEFGDDQMAAIANQT